MRGNPTSNDRLGNYLQKKANKQKLENLEDDYRTDRCFEARSKKLNVYFFPSLGSNLPIQPERTVHIHNHQDLQKYLISSQDLSKQKKEAQSIIEDELPIKMKRLKKLRQLEENQCAICLQQIKKKCQLQCKHKFCFTCAQNWFETSNKCPLCRAQIHSFWYKGEEYFVEAKEQDLQSDFSADYSSDSSESVGQVLDGQCYNCEDTREGDTVLICDRCEINSCHIRCDSSLRGVLPSGQWYCHFCR